MAETVTNPIEAEIAALTREIEIKRRALEAQNGIVSEGEDKEFVRTALAEKIRQSFSAAPPASSVSSAVPVPPPPPKPASQGASYLDSLDDATSAKVNVLIQEFFTKGLERAIRDAKNEEPYVMDAFHDALTDKLYEELKRRKAVQ